ncbi:MAG TPA: flagellar hook capping FlgD N-terminal domain-containing protein [Bryobacteraceae bacterium]|nr:flagellar hook capping FlgD N-terminal domain-containing protein [Bryobacteraceae bacterium]
MASIGSTLFSNANPAAGASGAAGSGDVAAPNSLANQSTFLQLLVAQLKNQDPSQPMDGTTFVTQLAQFSTLEQSVASRQDLDAIAKLYTGSSSVTGGAGFTAS